MDIIEIYECECNPKFIYKSKNSFKAHFKSKRHQNFENRKNAREERVKAKQNENEISVLNHEIANLKKRETILTNILVEYKEKIKEQANEIYLLQKKLNPNLE